MKTLVALQGGGALGAFQAGAWRALQEGPAGDLGEIVGVLGASIGAINGACLVRHLGGPDAGAEALRQLWADLRTPPWPFSASPGAAGTPAALGEAWLGMMTGVMCGTRHLSRVSPSAWWPGAGLRRLHRPLHDRAAMWHLLQRYAGYDSRAGGPLLGVAAVDVLSGELRLFDSDEGPVDASRLAASSAIPLLYEPVEIDGRLHWDGEMTRDSALPPMLRRLRATGRVGADEPLQLLSIEVLPRQAAALPESGVEMVFRLLSLLLQDKLLPPAEDLGVRIERHRRIVRPPLPEDGVSGQFDFSPRRLEALYEQGLQLAATGAPGAGALAA